MFARRRKSHPCPHQYHRLLLQTSFTLTFSGTGLEITGQPRLAGIVGAVDLATLGVPECNVPLVQPELPPLASDFPLPSSSSSLLSSASFSPTALGFRANSTTGHGNGSNVADEHAGAPRSANIGAVNNHGVETRPLNGAMSIIDAVIDLRGGDGGSGTCVLANGSLCVARVD